MFQLSSKQNNPNLNLNEDKHNNKDNHNKQKHNKKNLSKKKDSEKKDNKRNLNKKNHREEKLNNDVKAIITPTTSCNKGKNLNVTPVATQLLISKSWMILSMSHIADW